MKGGEDLVLNDNIKQIVPEMPWYFLLIHPYRRMIRVCTKIISPRACIVSYSAPNRNYENKKRPKRSSNPKKQRSKEQIRRNCSFDCPGIRKNAYFIRPDEVCPLLNQGHRIIDCSCSPGPASVSFLQSPIFRNCMKVRQGCICQDCSCMYPPHIRPMPYGRMILRFRGRRRQRGFFLGGRLSEKCLIDRK